jgi:uncharacterized protein (TIGR02246 family)
MTTAVADKHQSAEAALAEMESMFGGVPSVFQGYPKSAVAAGWALMKSTDLNENTALSAKVRELIGLAVAAQIPCQYCIYYHTKASRAFGATEEEIKEAVHMSSLVRHWSTMLQGSQYDFEAFKAETDAAFPEGAASSMSAREGIEAALVEFASAFNKGDGASVAALYTEDALLLPPGGARVDGREAIQAFWQGAIDQGLTDIKLEAVEVESAGNTAYEVGGFSLKAPNESGELVSSTGKYIVVWHKSADGNWRLHRDIWNSTPQSE